MRPRRRAGGERPPQVVTAEGARGWCSLKPHLLTPKVDDGDSDGWWSPRAAAATEISRAAAASLAETDEEARYPQI